MLTHPGAHHLYPRAPRRVLGIQVCGAQLRWLVEHAAASHARPPGRSLPHGSNHKLHQGGGGAAKAQLCRQVGDADGGVGREGGREVGGSYAPTVNLGVADSREGF